MRTHHDTTEHQHAHARARMHVRKPAQKHTMSKHLHLPQAFADTEQLQVSTDGLLTHALLRSDKKDKKNIALSSNWGGFKLGVHQFQQRPASFFLIAELYTGSNEFELSLEPTLVSCMVANACLLTHWLGRFGDS